MFGPVGESLYLYDNTMVKYGQTDGKRAMEDVFHFHAELALRRVEI
jgi:hypothetical protein